MNNKEKKDYKHIGIKIREARKSADISQKELAQLIGYESITAISLIESGDRKVSISSLEKIAKILKYDIRWFLPSYKDCKLLEDGNKLINWRKL